MAALRDYLPLQLAPLAVPESRPRLARTIVAVLLLTVMGVLAAASVFASKPYQHAQAPAPGKFQPPVPTANSPTPDGC